MRSYALGLLVLAVLPSCTRSPPSGAGRSSETPASASSVAQPAVEQPPPIAPAPPPGPWRDLVRDQRWAEAETQLDALAEGDRARPEMRYLRARVAHERKRPATVLTALDGLDALLPLFAEGIAKLRAEAQAEVGPFEPAAAYFASKTGVKAQTRAAEAYLRAGRADEARRTIDRAIGAGKGGGAEASARAVRLGLAEASGQRDVALADARWILREAPESSAADAAAASIARLDPSSKPTASELLARAEKLAAAAKAEQALAAIESAKTAEGAPPEADRAHALGMALYKLRRYAEASEVLARAAKSGAKTAEDDAFHAARALSRAGRDDEAIAAYRALVAQHPKSPLADEASYLAARLSFLTGKNADAQVAYAAYLKKHRGGKHAGAAAYELALVDFADRPARARTAFAELARSEDVKAESARLRELEGAAALRAGDTDGAREAFAAVIRAAPLSFPALAARAHLARMNAPAPAPIEPAEAQSASSLEVKLPPLVVALHALGLDDEAEDALRAREREVSAAYAPRSAEALCEGYGQLDQATRRYRVGQDHVKAETLLHEPSQATRWTWDCLYPRPYLEAVRAVEAREALPRGLVHAVMRQESAFDVDVVSGAHAVGLMQLLPTTARELAKRASVPFEEGSLVRPGVNVDLGARYLAMLLKTWKGSLPLAIASYNAGPSAISRWVEGAGPVDVDVWVARIPYPETRTYVLRVLGNLARYAYLEGGVGAIPALELSVDPALRAQADAF